MEYVLNVCGCACASIAFYKCIDVFHTIYLACDMGLHNLTFMEENQKNKMKLMPIRILNSDGYNSKNIVDSVGVFNGVDANNKEYRKTYLNEQCSYE